LVGETLEWLKDIRVRTVSLADTAGNATPQIVADVFNSVKDYVAGIELGVHLHGSPTDAEDKVLAAYAMGCRRFDAALTGLGGCPFAGDELVGNIPTERVLSALGKVGADAQIPEGKLAKVLAMTAELRAKYAHSAPVN
jgi:hydroxymethylglutaryl-CoA lyase